MLHAVTSSSGGSLAQIPAFGILDFTGPLRVFLRGGLDLTVELPAGTVEVDGLDVTTWNERRFDAAVKCRLAIPDGAGPELPDLPLHEGVVLLQSLALTLDAGTPAIAAGQAVGAAIGGSAIAVEPAARPDPETGAAVP